MEKLEAIHSNYEWVYSIVFFAKNFTKSSFRAKLGIYISDHAYR